MKNITTGTIVRTVVLLFALANQVLTIAGKSVLPFTEGEVADVVATALTAGSALWAWWKNNSVTPEAIAADEFLQELKRDDD